MGHKMFGLFQRLWRSESAAVAPLAAISLFALLAVGGVGFDYARLAGMDTELQQAADQAALAAATQLDRTDGSRTRAAASIQDNDGTHRLAANFTRFARRAGTDGATVEIDSITFCKSFDDSVRNTNAACDSEDVDDNNAVYVVVTSSIRTADYALTPIVAAVRGTSSATAVA